MCTYMCCRTFLRWQTCTPTGAPGWSPPRRRKRPEERPHAEGRGARPLLQQWKFLEESWKVLWFTIHLFLYMQHERNFTPGSLWNMEQFFKEFGVWRTRDRVIPVWTNRLNGILAPSEYKKKIYCVNQLTCQHKLLSFLCQYRSLYVE